MRDGLCRPRALERAAIRLYLHEYWLPVIQHAFRLASIAMSVAAGPPSASSGQAFDWLPLLQRIAQASETHWSLLHDARRISQRRFRGGKKMIYRKARPSPAREADRARHASFHFSRRMSGGARELFAALRYLEFDEVVDMAYRCSRIPPHIAAGRRRRRTKFTTLPRELLLPAPKRGRDGSGDRYAGLIFR